MREIVLECGSIESIYGYYNGTCYRQWENCQQIDTYNNNIRDCTYCAVIPIYNQRCPTADCWKPVAIIMNESEFDSIILQEYDKIELSTRELFISCIMCCGAAYLPVSEPKELLSSNTFINYYQSNNSCLEMVKVSKS